MLVKQKEYGMEVTITIFLFISLITVGSNMRLDSDIECKDKIIFGSVAEESQGAKDGVKQKRGATD